VAVGLACVLVVPEAGEVASGQRVADALERARELHDRLAALVARLEGRLDRRPPGAVDPDR